MLKKSFDEFVDWNSVQLQELEDVRTEYLRFSRKVSWAINPVSETAKKLLDYLDNFTDRNELLFVDEGWYGHSQDSLEKICPWNIKGYYLGLIENTKRSDRRKGVLFGENADKTKSPYYGVFRTNCTFYEQILTAPHGSLISIEKDNKGGFLFNEDWAPQERELYKNHTRGLQEKMLNCMKFLLAWDSDLKLYDFAKYKLKTLLFANKKRVHTLNVYDKNFYNNFTASQERWFGKRSSIKINIIELLISPENYMRYFCKIKERRTASIKWNTLYHVFTPLIYGYCRLSLMVKHHNKVWKDKI